MRITVQVGHAQASWDGAEGFTGDGALVDAAMDAIEDGRTVNLGGAAVTASDLDALGAWAALAATDPGGAVLASCSDPDALQAVLDEARGVLS